MNSWAPLSQPIIFSTLGTLFLSLALFQNAWPEWIPPAVRLTVFVVGLVLLVLAVALIIFFLWDISNTRFEKSVELLEKQYTAQAITEDYLKLQLIISTDKEHLSYLREFVPVIKILAGLPYPLKVLETPSVDIPLSFLEEFLDSCTLTHLASVRSWSDGSFKNEYADAFTKLMCKLGYAEEGVGNTPARWINRKLGLRAIGAIIEKDVEEEVPA